MTSARSLSISASDNSAASSTALRRTRRILVLPSIPSLRCTRSLCAWHGVRTYSFDTQRHDQVTSADSTIQCTSLPRRKHWWLGQIQATVYWQTRGSMGWRRIGRFPRDFSILCLRLLSAFLSCDGPPANSAHRTILLANCAQVRRRPPLIPRTCC